MITFEIVFECTSSLHDKPRCQSSEKPGSGCREGVDTPKQAPSKREVILRSHASTVQSNHDLEKRCQAPIPRYIMTEDLNKSSSSFSSEQLKISKPKHTPQSLFLSRRMPRPKRRRGYLSQHARRIGKVRRRPQEDMHSIIQ